MITDRKRTNFKKTARPAQGRGHYIIVFFFFFYKLYLPKPIIKIRDGHGTMFRVGYSTISEMFSSERRYRMGGRSVTFVARLKNFTRLPTTRKQTYYIRNAIFNLRSDAVSPSSFLPRDRLRLGYGNTKKTSKQTNRQLILHFEDFDRSEERRYWF